MPAVSDQYRVLPGSASGTPRALAALLSVLLMSCGASHQEVLMEGRGVEVSLMHKLPSGVMTWIHAQGKSLAEGRTDLEGVREASWERIVGDDPDGKAGDLLTFFVVMDATRQLDIQEGDRMKEQEAIAVAQEKLRGLTGMIKEDLDENSDKDEADPCLAPECGPFQQVLGDLENALDKCPTWIRISVREPQDIGDVRSLAKDVDYLSKTMKELSELTSVRLKAVVERRSNIISTLSKLMKKVSSTQDAVIQNIK
jgi:hypothetical protein